MKKKNDLGAKLVKHTFFETKTMQFKKWPKTTKTEKPLVYFGTESISSLAPKILRLIPSNIRNANPLGIFKEKLKLWATDKCPCALYKTYIGNVDFTWKCSKEIKHTTCGVNLPSFSNDLLYMSNFLCFNTDE